MCNGVYMCMYTPVKIPLQVMPLTLCFETGSFVGMEMTRQVSLNGKQDPEIPLSLIPTLDQNHQHIFKMWI